MSETDFDDFSQLWLEEGEAAGADEFRALARRTELRAKLLRFADYGLAALIVIAVAIALSFDTAPATVLFGLLLGLAAVWATWKRRTLHQSTLVDMVDSEAMIAAALARCRTELQQSLWGLLLAPLGMLLAVALKYSVRTGGDMARFPAAFLEVVSAGQGLLGIILVGLVELYLLYRSRRLRRELRRLIRIAEEYRAEARFDRELRPAAH